jgi:HxlR-like helix-turn-helix
MAVGSLSCRGFTIRRERPLLVPAGTARQYPGQNCSLARALEIVGERWTLLIIRDAFLGLRRFDQFQQSLGIARNVLTSCAGISDSKQVMAALVAKGTGALRAERLELVPGPGATRGEDLWWRDNRSDTRRHRDLTAAASHATIKKPYRANRARLPPAGRTSGKPWCTLAQTDYQELLAAHPVRVAVDHRIE